MILKPEVVMLKPPQLGDMRGHVEYPELSRAERLEAKCGNRSYLSSYNLNASKIAKENPAYPDVIF